MVDVFQLSYLLKKSLLMKSVLFSMIYLFLFDSLPIGSLNSFFSVSSPFYRSAVIKIWK